MVKNMGLKPFDNTWYCDKCGERIKNEDDFIYCPNCGNVLKNDWYQMSLQSIEDYLNKYSSSICENCCEEFDKDYNFCPLCSNELKKEGILIRVEKDNSITADWNGEEISVFNKSIFLSSPHFSGTTVLRCFENKNHMDRKLESDFRKIGLKPPEKITFEEACRIFESWGRNVLCIEKFFPKSNTEDSDDGKLESDRREVLKIREDLFVKLAVEYLIY